MTSALSLHRLGQDRLRVLSALAILAALCWIYLANQAREMRPHGPLSEMAPQTHLWGVGDLLLLFVMWAVMMIAMMAPSAAPLVLTYARAGPRHEEGKRRPAYTHLLSGYLLAWIMFAVLATVGQWGLHSVHMLSPMMTSTSHWFGGIVLVSAGVYQTTPLKHACLRRCRSPLGHLMSEWQKGNREPLRIGLKHGVYCVGCCWLLMGLLFVAGVMNLLWVAAIAAFVLVERITPKGHLVGSIAGVFLIAAGFYMILV